MKLFKNNKLYSALLIFCILIFLSSNLYSLFQFFQSNQVEGGFSDINISDNLFDGMDINYTFTFGEANPVQFIYTNISDSEFHVDRYQYESGSTSHGYWDVDAQTRLIANSGGSGLPLFGNGYHTPIWIITDVSIGDKILIAVDGEGDHLFEVTSDLIYEIPDFGPVGAWILEDLNVSGGVAWYEKSTGILLNGLFYFDEGNNNYQLEFENTNAVFNYTEDYELGVSLEIPTFCEVNVTHQINATVRNYGIEDVFNINLYLYLDGVNVISSMILNLLSGSNETISYYWTPITYGEYNFTAYTPPLPNELLLENNYATEIIPLHQIHLFDEMHITYTSYLGVNFPMHLNYSYVSGNKFHMDCNISGTENYAYWDIDAQTRVIENSGGNTLQFGNGYHTPIWIITNVSIGDQILIAVDGEGDHLFEVTSELVYEIPGIGPIEAWILEDLNVSGGVAWYEKNTGMLLNGSFYFNAGADSYKFELMNSNIEFNFMHDHELGISLKVLKIPSFLGIELKLQMNITITNYGLKDVFNINISLYLDGIILNLFEIANLPSGSNKTITYYWTPYEYSTYNFTFYLPPIQGETYLYNNYITKIVEFPPTRIFAGMYIYGRVTDYLMSYPSNLSYSYASDNILYGYWHLQPPYSGDDWKVDLTTRELTGSDYFNYLTHTPFWIFINVSLGDIVLISVLHENDHEFKVSNKLVYDLPQYGPVEIWELRDLAHPNAVVWYEKSTGILLNGTFLSNDSVGFYIFDFFTSNARFSYVYPPNPFELSTDADTPSDNDGEFNLFWTAADGALTYTVYQHSSPITEINDSLTILLEDTTDLQLNLNGYTDGTYYFIVVAYNDYGERKSNCIKVDIEIPQLPGPFDLYSDADTPFDSDGDFNLLWTESDNAHNYSVYLYAHYITEINGSLTRLSEEITDRKLIISGYTDGTYYFIIVAYNDYGERKSNCIQVDIEIPQLPGPFNLYSDADTPSDSDGDFSLFWTESNDAHNYSVYLYSHYITEINGSLTLLSEEITDRELIISGYTDGTYYFIVVAKNNEGNTLSNCFKVIVEIPTSSSSTTSISSYPLYFIGITSIVVILILFKKKSRVKQIS